MPRQVRIRYAAAFYHAMARGDRGENIFLDDTDREQILKNVRRSPESRDGSKLSRFVD